MNGIRAIVLGLLFAVAAHAALPGELVVVIASKGQFKGEPDFQGMDALAESAHRHGHPVTWFLKPVTVGPASERLKKWKSQYGDELAWFAEHAEPGPGEEYAEMKKLVTWQPIRSAGNSRYDRLFYLLAEKQGITGIWGAYFEQSYAEALADRGTTFGFHYMRPDCYKVPNPRGAGIVSVPWVSTDINLTFRLGGASGFTFDPDDVIQIGVAHPGRSEYWKRLVDEYRKQTVWNEVVPLIIQQEYTSVGDALRRKDPASLALLGDLFQYLREQRIRVVTMSDAVALFRKAHPDTTPPTYALYDNLGADGLPAQPAAHPKTGRLQRLQVISNRISGAQGGVGFNGFYASTLSNQIRSYVDLEGRAYPQQGRLLAYYDVLGLLMFEEGRSAPIRITPYASLPENPHKPRVLPEMSAWFNTQDKIPQAQLLVTNALGAVRITAQANWERSASFGGERLAYGLMLWGDYSAYRLPAKAPAGSRILGRSGLLLAFPLVPGDNRLELTLER